jgi:hypothetical protein
MRGRNARGAGRPSPPLRTLYQLVEPDCRNARVAGCPSLRVRKIQRIGKCGRSSRNARVADCPSLPERRRDDDRRLPFHSNPDRSDFE